MQQFCRECRQADSFHPVARKTQKKQIDVSDDTPRDHVWHRKIGESGNLANGMEQGDPEKNYDFHPPKVKNVYHTDLVLPTIVTKGEKDEPIVTLPQGELSGSLSRKQGLTLKLVVRSITQKYLKGETDGENIKFIFLALAKVILNHYKFFRAVVNCLVPHGPTAVK